MDLRLSEVSENIEQAHVAEWLVDHGSMVSGGQEILEIVTDKASFTIEAPASGKLSIKVSEGDKIEKNDLIGTIT